MRLAQSDVCASKVTVLRPKATESARKVTETAVSPLNRVTYVNIAPLWPVAREAAKRRRDRQEMPA